MLNIYAHYPGFTRARGKISYAPVNLLERRAVGEGEQQEFFVTKSKFRIGDRVNFTSGTVGRPGMSDGYTVTNVLPEERGEQQYRIKSESEAHERVVIESQLDRRA